MFIYINWTSELVESPVIMVTEQDECAVFAVVSVVLLDPQTDEWILLFKILPRLEWPLPVSGAFGSGITAFWCESRSHGSVKHSL